MTGKIRRAEYWTVTVAFAILNGIIGIINDVLGDLGVIGTLLTVVLSIVAFLMSVCTLGLGIQKVRATTGSGWKYATIFIPIAGPFIVLYWLLKADDPTVIFD
jgi:uncharacterized membrane protein YhaH (DUF805 family)